MDWQQEKLNYIIKRQEEKQEKQKILEKNEIFFNFLDKLALIVVILSIAFVLVFIYLILLFLRANLN